MFCELYTCTFCAYCMIKHYCIQDLYFSTTVLWYNFNIVAACSRCISPNYFFCCRLINARHPLPPQHCSPPLSFSYSFFSLLSSTLWVPLTFSPTFADGGLQLARVGKFIRQQKKTWYSPFCCTEWNTIMINKIPKKTGRKRTGCKGPQTKYLWMQR